MDLHQLRAMINQIDDKIIDLLNQRAKLAIKIGKQKKKLNLPIADKRREQQVLQKIAVHNKGPLSNQQIINIYRTIITHCRNIQLKN